MTKPQTQSRAPESEFVPLSGYQKEFAAQGDDPQMPDYIRSICAQPQPQRAQLGNDLIRTNGMVAECAFDQEHKADMTGAHGLVMTTSSAKTQ